MTAMEPEAFTRDELIASRDADAEAKRELWEIGRKKEQARRQAPTQAGTGRRGPSRRAGRLHLDQW